MRNKKRKSAQSCQSSLVPPWEKDQLLRESQHKLYTQLQPHPVQKANNKLNR